jgi:hypothetical protein
MKQYRSSVNAKIWKYLLLPMSERLTAICHRAGEQATGEQKTQHIGVLVVCDLLYIDARHVLSDH